MLDSDYEVWRDSRPGEHCRCVRGWAEKYRVALERELGRVSEGDKVVSDSLDAPFAVVVWTPTTTNPRSINWLRTLAYGRPV